MSPATEAESRIWKSFVLKCLISADIVLVVYRRSPFAGVVRTCYPLSMAFDGRLTENFESGLDVRKNHFFE